MKTEDLYSVNIWDFQATWRARIEEKMEAACLKQIH